jgi:hypothetical protein
MDSESVSVEQVHIRCPDCGQRFRVGADLKGRMVECGGCMRRFKVEDDTYKTKKFYPGEKLDTNLMKFGKNPHLEIRQLSSMPVVSYNVAPDPSAYEPTPLARIMVGIVGCVIMLVVMLMLFLGAKQGGLLDGVTTSRRLVMALLTAVLGAAMIIYANPRARIKASFFALLGAVILIIVPFIFKQGSSAMLPTTAEAVIEKNELKENVEKIDPQKKIEDLKSLVGYSPIDAAIKEKGPNVNVQGVWLKDIKKIHTALVVDFLIRIAGANSDSHLYPRVDGSFLMVLVDSRLSLDLLAEECSRLGQIDVVEKDLNLLMITVENNKFTEQPIVQLNDNKNDDFYARNYIELESVDLNRVNRALLRLSTTNAYVLRADIVKRIISLLNNPDLELLNNASKALFRWSDGKDHAVEAIAKATKDWHKKNQTFPLESIKFLVKWNHPEVFSMLDEMWLKEPVKWEEIYAQGSSVAEDYITKHINKSDLEHRISAARILGKVGTSKSISLLQDAIATTNDGELKVSYKNAIESIQYRSK